MDAKIELLKRSIERLSDKTLATELEARLQESAPKLKELHNFALYTSVGQALSHWAGMEELLVAIASLLLRTHEATKVGIIMYSIVNFGFWLSVIDELFLQEPLYTPLKPKWNKINSRLRGLKRTRDRLAHHTIHYGDKVATLTGDTSLRPGRFDTRQEQKSQSMDLDQILIFTGSISKVAEDLTALLNAMTDLLKRETLQQKSSEPTPG
jgi:hypothetical protein